jgi:PHD/YefM family antitoxin component YafN of YafNO toxin-antitoxin module
MTLNPQFIQTSAGENLVVLSEKEYNQLLQRTENLLPNNDFVLTQEHKDILDQRMEDYHNGAKTYTWEQVKQNVLKNAK